MRVDSHQCPLRLNNSICIGKVCRKVLHRILCCRLKIHINGGIDLQTILINCIVPIFLSKDLKYIINKIGGPSDSIIAWFYNGQRFLLRDICLTLTDIAVFDHLIENNTFTLGCCLHIVERRVVVWTLWDTGKHCTFIQRQIFGILAKIGACCRLNAISPLTKIDLVHVKFQNFIFRVLAFELKCKKYFLYLSFQRLILRQISILSKLLCDGRTALGDRTSANIRPNGTYDSARINADMFVKSIVFDCNEGILKIFWNLVDPNRSAILCRMNIGNLIAVNIIDL